MTTIINGSSPSITFSDGTTQSTSARTGATITSSGTDVTLTASSSQVQRVTMTATNLAVILPDATAYASSALGSPVFVITNGGSNPFDIETSTGFIVFSVAIGQTCIISLSGNSTQAQWVGCLSSNTTTPISRGLPSTITTTIPTFAAGTNQAIQVAALSSTSLLAVWLNSNTGHSYAAVGTISGTAITWGTPTAISTARAYTCVNVVALSSTTALIYGMAFSVGSYFNGVSISGTTITVSTISAAAASGDANQYPFLPLTSTTAIFFVGNSGSGISNRVVTYNGASAPTFGTAVNNGNGGGFNVHAVALSSTAVLCFADGSASLWNARVSTISGTTVTLGTNLALPNTYFPNSSGGGSLIKISDSEVIFTSTASAYVQKFTISGSTVTASTAWNNQAYNILTQNGGANALLSATDFIGSTTTSASVLNRYSYNTSTGVANLGTAAFSRPLYPYGYCYVTANTGAIVGIDPLTNYPSGYLVYLT